jgi:hypothetical protein
MESSLTAICVTITASGVLDTNGHRLTLNGDAVSTIDGRLLLSEQGSTIAIERHDHEFSGSGFIAGSHGNAKILIANGMTLTNETLIAGALRIEGLAGPAMTGAFVNAAAGTVAADFEAGTLEIGPVLLRSGDGAWEVKTYSSSVLEFNAGNVCLGGPFFVSQGTLRIDADVITDGPLMWNGGTIDVANGQFFGYGSFEGACGNPDPTGPPFLLGGGEYTCD